MKHPSSSKTSRVQQIQSTERIRKRRNEELREFSCHDELNNADAQDESLGQRTGKSKVDTMNRQSSVTEGVGEYRFPYESLEEKRVTPSDSGLINYLLPRSIGIAIDKCNEEQRTTIASDDLIEAAKSLGAEDFLDRTKSYVQQHIKPEESTSNAEIPGYEDWYNDLQGLLKMVPRHCSTRCPCRLVRFRRDNYK